MDTIQNEMKLLERSRNAVLNLGYKVIFIKSKLKKAFVLFKRQLTPTILNL